MLKPTKLYKTTIIIWSPYNPEDQVEIDDLARDAMRGESYCSSCSSEEITDPGMFPDTEFFGVDTEDEA